MKKFNLWEDPEGTPEKKPSEFDEEITPDTLDELIQTRETAEETPPPEPIGMDAEPAPESTDTTAEDMNLDAPEPEEEVAGFESSFPKKRVFLILGIVIVLILGGVLLFILLSSPEETPPTAEATPQESVSPNASETQTPPQPAIDPALLRQLAANKAHNEAITKLTGSVFATRAGGAAPAFVVTEGNNFIITVRAATVDDAARFRMAFKEKFPNVTISSMGKSVNAGGKGGYWDLALPMPAAKPASSGVEGKRLSVAAFQNGVQKLARQNGLRNVKIQKGPRVADRSFRSQIFYVEVNGKLNNIIAFLNQLTSDFPAARIAKLRMGYPNFNTSAPRVDAQLDIYVLTE